MSLSTLVSDDNWQGFDEAWKNLIQREEDPVDDLLSALTLVADKRRMPRCLPLLKEHAQTLVDQGRPADAARLLGAALRGGGPQGELGDPLLQAAEKAWGQEPWWEAYGELSGLQEGGDLRRAWGMFDDLCSYRAGVILFHPAGWGTGEVIEIRPEQTEITVRFQSGRTDQFPMRTAVEIFELLPEEDLRARSFRDPEGLRSKLKEEPLEILRSILQRFNGKASSVTLRNALMQVGITGNAWTSWWRKTRLLAENSEWFRVTGNATRAEVRLLAKAMDPVEGLRRQMEKCQTFGEALTRVRDVLTGGKLEENLRQTALDSIEELAGREPRSEAEQMAVGLLLREQRGTTPEALLELLRAAAAEPTPTDPSQPPALWALLLLVPTARDQERCAELLREVHGEAWLDDVSENLAHATPGMIKPLIEAMKAGGRERDLERHYATLLARPLRVPHTLVALAREVEGWDGGDALPGPVQRAQALLELEIYLTEHQRGNPLLGRANTKLVNLLARGEQPLLRKLLAGADAPTLHGLRLMMQRGVEDPVDNLITDIAIEAGSASLDSDKPFWDTDEIWTTRGGIVQRESELRELREVKIPANREAIARAASYGDLSENAEWEQAIREQSELTGQAAQMERELRQAALLENAPIPEDRVCPGTLVRYRDVSDDSEHSIALLGPWDRHEGAVCYRAPLPAGMLGRRTGERVVIQLPSGQTEVEILGIEPAPID